MNLSVTVSGFDKTEVTSGTDLRPVFLQFKSADRLSDINIFMNYAEGLALAAQLRVACGAQEEPVAS